MLRENHATVRGLIHSVYYMDPLSIFLAKLLGLYFLVSGIVIWARQKSLIPAVAQLGENRAVILVVALLELLAGLAILIAHPYFTADWRGIITFVGAWMIAESLLLLFAPDARVRKFIRYFNRPTWYASGAVLSIVLGLYLAGTGFGWW